MQRVAKTGCKDGQLGAHWSHTKSRKLPSLQIKTHATVRQTDSVPMAGVIPPTSENHYLPPTIACGSDLQASPVSHPVFAAQQPESISLTSKDTLLEHGGASKCHPNRPQLDVITQDCQHSTEALQKDQANFKFTASAPLFRKHRNLIELLERKEALQQNTAPAPASRVDLPEGSKTLLRHFLRGYVGTTLVHQKHTTRHPTFEEFALSDLFAEVDEGMRAEPPQNATQGDHYDYFSCVPVDNAGNLHDQSHRLQCMRMLNRRHRVLLQKSTDITNGVMVSIGRSESAHDRAQSNSPHVDGVLTHRSTAFGIPPSSGSSFWGPDSAAQAQQTIKGLTTQALKADMCAQKACESLRDLIFGVEYTEASRSNVTGAFYEDKSGTKEEVMLLQMQWSQMDTDRSGKVEYQEFLEFFGRRKVDRECGLRCIKYLVGKHKHAGVDDDVDEGVCTIEDIMRLLWLKASDQDVQKMMTWFHEAELQKDRIPTPPLLPERKQRLLLDSFPSFAKEKKDKVTFSELLASGLFTEGSLMVVREQFGKELTKGMTREEVLEILCPNGYLAHKNVKKAVDVNGRPIALVTSKIYTGWVVAGSQKQICNTPVA